MEDRTYFNDDMEIGNTKDRSQTENGGCHAYLDFYVDYFGLGSFTGVYTAQIWNFNLTKKQLPVRQF
jgi:hypothetical protein